MGPDQPICDKLNEMFEVNQCDDFEFRIVRGNQEEKTSFAIKPTKRRMPSTIKRRTIHLDQSEPNQRNCDKYSTQSTQSKQLANQL